MAQCLISEKFHSKAVKFFIIILLLLLSYKFDEQADLFFKSIRFAFLDAILGIITNFGIVTLVILIIPLIILYKKHKKLVYLILLTFIVSISLSFIIKLIVLRQRPIEAFAYPFVNIINYSFPSMHAMVVFSMLPLLTKYLPKQNFFWTAFAFLVAFSRVYFGFHFLSDIVFGALFGHFIGVWLLELYDKGKLWK